MFFKNAHVYALHDAPPLTDDALTGMLEEHAHRPLGDSEKKRLGWTKPGGPGSQVRLHSINGQRLLTVLRQERMLPPSVVAEEVEERAADREAAEGRPLRRQEKQALKEQVYEELLPRAFVRSQRIDVWWDTVRSRIVVNASSRARAEDTLDLLRQTLGSLKVTPLATQVTPTRAMTEWLNRSSSRPGWLELGDQVELKSTTGDDGIIRARQVDLDGEEVQAALEAGRQASKLAFRVNESVSLVLGDDLSLKSLRFADAVLDEAAQDESGDDPIARLESDFLLMTQVLARAVEQLIDALGGEATPALADGEAPDMPAPAADDDADPLYGDAVALVTSTRRASVSGLQRALKLGYNRAARLIESMEAAGVVSPMDTNGQRTVLGGAA